MLTLDDELLTDGMKELSPRMQRSRCALMTACFIRCSQIGQLTSDSSRDVDISDGEHRHRCIVSLVFTC